MLNLAVAEARVESDAPPHSRSDGHGPWQSLAHMKAWVRLAENKAAYQRRLAVWLVVGMHRPVGEVAEALVVSRQSVWSWVSAYTKNGPDSLDPKRRGGRKRAHLSPSEELSFIKTIQKRVAAGETVTARMIKPHLEAKIGTGVSLSYVYRLLGRHGWN